MAIDLIFRDIVNKSKLQIYVTEQENLHVSIEGDGFEMVELSREEAIKLSKELKKQISLIPY